MVTLLLLLAAIALLVWGFVRARPYGEIGVFAWLQSVVLMVPWLLFFGLFTLGLYINLAGVLALVIISAGAYIYLGRRLRTLGEDELAAQKLRNYLSVSASEPTSEIAEAEKAEVSAAMATAATATGKEPNQDQTAAERLVTAQPEAEALTIAPEDRTALEGIFGVDTFFRTETLPYDQGAIFKGNLRTQPDQAIAQLSQLADERLEQRFRLFLIADPQGKPVIVALPKTTDPQPLTPVQKGFAVVMAIATVLTCLEASGILMGFDLLTTPEKWPQALPFALGTLTILIAHEIGHWFMAQRRAVQLSWPFFLPTWDIGTFGA
ncbi:MAG: site-2 protease family protein, partial [Cyanobacteria bacterium P01_C01_bin.120]